MLIVSDDPLLSLDLEMSLNAQGYSTQFTGYSGVSSAIQAGHGRFSGVILDIHKPEAVCEHLASGLKVAQLPIIVLSTFDRDTVPWLPCGTAWYMKPLNVDDLDTGAFRPAKKDEASEA
ncbi:hypothetical protein [Pseudooceanicola sp.]|uniref:hypothetical protein n=1 Tax=Pseudooceanicola sp. TaxID=1914328 RepID=UPI0035C6712C